MKGLFYSSIFIGLMALALSGCKKETLTPCEAAELYYGYLIDGKVDKYVESLHDYDSLPEDYRSQLRDMFLQYLDREEQMRGGLVGAHALRDTLIDSLHAHVFVEVQFGDSTCEQVFLPLVLTDKGWRLR